MSDKGKASGYNKGMAPELLKELAFLTKTPGMLKYANGDKSTGVSGKPGQDKGKK